MRCFFLCLLLALAACASPDIAKAPVATPPVLAAFRGDPPVATAADWVERRAPLLREALLEAVYGQPPDLGEAVVERIEALDLEEVGEAVIQQWTVRLGDGEGRRRFHMVVATPPGPGPFPLVVLQLFCSTRSALPEHPESVFEDEAALPGPCGGQALDPVIRLVFGQRIAGPDIAEVTGRGYAVAMFHPGEVAPDDPDLGPPALAALQPEVPESRRAGALAVWAALYSRAYDVLAADPRFDPARVAAWGHSRHGKAALLAGALDPRFAAVISHQSGRGGASLTRSPAGETVGQITKSYGYWFSPAYRRGVPEDIDQHQLIALIAPRPVLLGNALADIWSDPAGAFRAAQGADPAYRLLGSPGFNAEHLTDFRPADGIVWWGRGRGHGVSTGDWTAFLDFLDHALARP